MKLPKSRHEPDKVARFFQEALEKLGGICEWSWHDRLHVLAEGTAASLWTANESVVDAELHFPPSDASGPRRADREVFPGCPLTFRVAELLHAEEVQYGRACLDLGANLKPPAPEAAQKQWEAQIGRKIAGKPTGPYVQDWHCSVLVLARCDVQAIDQHWSLHRLALSLPDGRVDEDLTSNLSLHAFKSPVPSEIPWSRWSDCGVTEIVRQALRDDIQTDLKAIQARQRRYLERELDRIDQYFRDYTRELRQRQTRQRRQESQSRYQERIDAAKAEHERRRQDQVQRHEIHVYPHIDALIFLAEPAWRAEIVAPREETRRTARFLPRNRRWVVE